MPISRLYISQNRRRANFALVVAIALCPLAIGCASSRGVALRKTPHNVLAEQLKLFARGGPQPTERTVQLLRRYDLTRDLSGDPQQLVAKLQEINRRESSPEIMYSIAEVAYLSGAKSELTDPQRTFDLYGTAVAHAYMYLFDDRLF
ncbi:MAG: hypothetical protein WD176_09535, partial [Pirellulales bacterium]